MAAETIVIDVVANFKNQTSAGMNSAKQSADKFTESVKKAKRETDRLGGTHAKPKVSVVDRATSTISKIDRGLSKLAGKVFKAPVKILDYATKPLRAITNSLFSIKGLIAGIGTAWAANQLLMKPINTADAYSSAKIGFSTLLGESEGQNMMNDLDAFAKATPFKTSGVIANAQKMMAMGWDAENIITDMKTIGDAAAATGKMDQGLESIVRALSQIKTKGKLSTEELNQLSEAGIAAKAMLAEQLGYGTGDSGIAKMTADLEKGLIGSDVAIKALLEGMKQFEGTMEKTANETVEGLKSQLEDTFEINILRKWGQGLQDGAKRGLGSILELLDASEDSLAKFGDTLYDIGKQLSNWAADKLEGTIDKIMKVTNSQEFKDASLGGKIKILWDEVVAEPFVEWWDTKGEDIFVEKVVSLGETLGSAFKKAFSAGIKVLFSGSWFTNLIATGLAIKLAAGIAKGVNLAQTVWSGTGVASGTGSMTLAGMGLKGVLGSASGFTGLLGFGSNLAINMGAGNLAGGASLGAGALSALGLGSAAGIVGGVAGLGNGIVDLTKAVKAQTNNDKKLYGTRSATKLGMVGTGAAAGAALGSIIPGVGTLVGTAVGAGLGGIATFLAGNKLADAISGVSKSTEEMNAEFEELAKKNLEKRFGDIELSAEQLSKRVKETFGAETINRVNQFNQSMKDLNTLYDTVGTHKSDLDYINARIKAGEELSETDIASYQSTLQSYADTVSQLLSGNKNASIDAFKLLYGDDTKGLQKATEGINKIYTGLEKELSEKTKELNETISDAFADGKIDIKEQEKINEIVKQIDKIYAEVEKHIQAKKDAENKAAYDLLELKYKDTDLTAKSFKELVSELDAQSKVDQKAYDDAFIQAKAEIDLEWELSDKGAEAKKKYEAALKEIEEKWLEGKAISVKRSVEVSLNVLNEQYKTEISNFEKKLKSDLENGLSKTNLSSIKGATSKIETSTQYIGGETVTSTITTDGKWNESSAKRFEEIKNTWLKDLGVDGALQKELSQMYESLKPQEEDLLALKKSYEDAGKEIPKWIEDSLADIENIKLMSGDMDSFYKVIGEQLATEDKAYAEKLLKTSGEDLPKALREGIERGLKSIESEPVEVKTNLELTADKKDIDTSGLDKTTKDVIEKLQDEDIIKITKDGEVSIKTKDGKVDTTGLDEDTKKAVEKLEKEGFIQIDKEGNVTIKATVDSETTGEDAAAEKSKGEAKGALDNAYSTTVSETGKVHTDSSTTGQTEAASKSFGLFTTSVDGQFVTQVDETGNVYVNGINISGIATAVSNAWQKLKEKVAAVFSNPISATGRVKYQIGQSGSGSGNGKKANGGYVDKAVQAIIGEAGPEMVIPLSANRRQRGKYLWERAGRAMGLYGTSSDEKVYMNANGGLYGLGSSKLSEMMNTATAGHSVRVEENSQKRNGNGTVQVNVGGITLSIHGSGKGIEEDLAENEDAIVGRVAEMLERAFQNMPIPVMD